MMVIELGSWQIENTGRGPELPETQRLSVLPDCGAVLLSAFYNALLQSTLYRKLLERNQY